MLATSIVEHRSGNLIEHNQAVLRGQRGPGVRPPASGPDVQGTSVPLFAMAEVFLEAKSRSTPWHSMAPEFA
jgi:hypothetical protein